MRKIPALVFSGMFSVLAVSGVIPVEAKENMRVRGALVYEPCKIAAQGEKLVVEFGTVIEKYLYLNQRTVGQPLELQLVDCDLNIGKSVRLTFKGVENKKSPGLLAISDSSSASGIAIGFETNDGKRLLLNKASLPWELNRGNTLIDLKTFIQAEPEALKNKSIKPGEFSSIVSFSLDYP